MELHNLIQGTPEWAAYRAQHFNASDAPAMMGVSPYKTRTELLRELHTGVAADVDAGTQRRFDNGHRAEALARPLAEEFIGSELYPVTGSLGRLSASFDGLTLTEDEGFEHKALNEELKAAFDLMLREQFGDDVRDCRFLPTHHRIQMEQQLLVSGATRILFMASQWDGDELVEEHHCWYYPDPTLRAQIIDGWAQFEKDLAAYTLAEPAAPAPVGKAPDTLPALRIEVTGAVTASNLAEFKQTALAAIRSVNKDLRTDADFADADKAVKWCADVEARLKAAKEHALSQTASIDELFKALDDIATESKAVRLDLAKVIDRRKVEVKEQAVAAARRALDAHVATLQAELAPLRLLPVAADFAAAIKGLRSIASMQDALDNTLATAKIAADAQARGIRANVAHFKEVATGMEALFADLGQLVHKAADDFAAVIGARIAKHRAEEAAKEEKRRAAEAERIAAAEAKARADEAARMERERQQAEAKRIQAENDAAAAMRTSLVPTPAPGLQSIPVADVAALQQRLLPAAPEVVHLRRHDGELSGMFIEKPAPKADEPATLKLGDINALFGPGFTMTAAFVSEVLRVQHSATDKSAKLYRPSDLTLICAALQKLAGKVAAGELVEVA